MPPDGPAASTLQPNAPLMPRRKHRIWRRPAGTAASPRLSAILPPLRGAGFWSSGRCASGRWLDRVPPLPRSPRDAPAPPCCRSSPRPASRRSWPAAKISCHRPHLLQWPALYFELSIVFISVSPTCPFLTTTLIASSMRSRAYLIAVGTSLSPKV